jgi:two-component system, NtrC family, nitrogen regulation sensor histidine kinase NtrY
MRLRGNAGNTSRGLLVVVLLFLFLTGGILVFSQQIIMNIAQQADPVTNALVLAAFTLLPLALLAVVVFQVSRLLRQRARREPGARLKSRLVLFFAFIALLSSTPQMILSITFINSTMSSWFGTRMSDTLSSAVDIALGWYREKMDSLALLGASARLPGLLEDFSTRPDRTWKEIKELKPSLDSLQIFSQDGTELFFRGDAQGRLASLAAAKIRTGIPHHEELESGTAILRSVCSIKVRDAPVYVSLVTFVPKELTTTGNMLTLALSTYNVIDRERELFRTILIAFYFVSSLPVFFISILVSMLLTEEISHPLVQLEEATRRVTEGDFSYRILTRRQDEFSHLVDSFNTMVSELDISRRKLLQAEKISAWQEIARRLAHEIRNPLTPIKLSAQRILKRHEEGAEDFGNVLSQGTGAIIREVENLERLLREFGDFARLPEPLIARTGLRDLLAETAAMYDTLSAKVKMEIADVPQNMILNVDRAQIKRVFANLFKNAIQAMPEGGSIVVRADKVRKGHSTFCRIQVRDTGEGIEERNKRMIFDPYFSTKKEGSGLGLAIAQRILFDHKGNIWVESVRGSGTTFFIDLPMEGP